MKQNREYSVLSLFYILFMLWAKLRQKTQKNLGEGEQEKLFRHVSISYIVFIPKSVEAEKKKKWVKQNKRDSSSLSLLCPLRAMDKVEAEEIRIG